MKRLLLLLSFLMTFGTIFAQCPPNIDFEQNNFSGWITKSGKRGSAIPTLTNPSVLGVIPGRQTLTTSGVDPFGGFPVVAPLGGLHSLRLGNSRTGDSCESVEYKFTIPNQNTFYLTYLYAIVSISNDKYNNFRDCEHLTTIKERKYNNATGSYDGSSW